MAITYLFIDDQLKKAKGFADGLSLRPEELVVNEPIYPLGWEEQIEYLIKERSNIDGLLLDLRLVVRDTNSQNNKGIQYQSPTLAEEIRTRAKEGVLENLPIILCSTDKKTFAQYYDSTSYDLFDAKYIKDDLTADDEEQQVINEFIAHAEAYQEIAKNRNDLKKLLKHDNILKDIELEFERLTTDHDKAALIREVVLPTGVLIDEDILAIRLGIDKKKSGEDWNTLKKEFDKKKYNNIKYKGIYSKAWQRWWMPELYKWWQEKFPDDIIQNTSASKKVELLKEKLGLERLTAIAKPEHHIYDTFWQKCALSDTPLESADGLRTRERQKYSWQNPKYISLKYVWNSSLNEQDEIRKHLPAFELDKFENLIKNQ